MWRLADWVVVSDDDESLPALSVSLPGQACYLVELAGCCTEEP